MSSGDVILETRGLTKEFKGFVAVDDVNLRVARGSIHALIGPNGAGKTTCFNLLTQFLKPTRGAILFNNQDITHERPERIAHRGVVRSFQISSVFPNLTVLENVRIALQRATGSRSTSGAASACSTGSTAVRWNCSSRSTCRPFPTQ